MSKKVFIVTGELSGDRLAAWYVKKGDCLRGVKGETPLHRNIQAIGGDYLHAEGVELYARFETLNVTGVIEIVKHIPRLMRCLKNVKNYIIENNFDKVILVDFPGFNLRLARALKKQKPDLKIIYLSPPQLWCWGAWRIASLKKYCDELIVLYPFEVAWYAKHDVRAVWQGNPIYEAMEPYFPLTVHKKNMIALMPGSRRHEIETLLPVLLQTVRVIKKQLSDVQFVMPLARSLSRDFLRSIAEKRNLVDVFNDIKLIDDETEKYQVLAQCSAALSKPGTVTLELALLEVPTVVFYVTSWLTYFLARMVVNVRWMSLPNLIMNKEMFPEAIQNNVTPENLAHSVIEFFSLKQSQSSRSAQIAHDFADLKAQLAVFKKNSIV